MADGGLMAHGFEMKSDPIHIVLIYYYCCQNVLCLGCYVLRVYNWIFDFLVACVEWNAFRWIERTKTKQKQKAHWAFTICLRWCHAWFSHIVVSFIHSFIQKIAQKCIREIKASHLANTNILLIVLTIDAVPFLPCTNLCTRITANFPLLLVSASTILVNWNSIGNNVENR